jgi:hypothetical protein
MTRLRIQVALLMLVLSAAVAVFSGVAVPFLNVGKHNLPAIQSNGAVILMADGTDPQPKPTPLPWFGVAS